jgi:hypothetical protein
MPAEPGSGGDGTEDLLLLLVRQVDVAVDGLT